MAVDAIIVGGGISGLAAAYELSTRGVSFVLLERARRAGGVILSEQIDGFTIDGGPDSLLIQKPERIRLWVQVLTAMDLDEGGTVHVLEAPSWQECRRRLDDLGGPPQ